MKQAMKKKVVRILFYSIGFLCVAVITLFLTMTIMVQYFGVSFARQTPYYKPDFFVESYWETKDSVIITDLDGECYGMMDGMDEVLYFQFYVPYDDPYNNTVSVYSSGEVTLPEAVQTVEKAKQNPGGVVSLELEYMGRINSCDTHHLDLRIGEETLLSFYYNRLDLGESGFRFREAEVWPEEMLQWIEQRGG